MQPSGHWTVLRCSRYSVLAADAITAWRKEGLPMDRLTCSSDGAGCLPTFDADGNLLEMDIGNPDTLLIAIQTLIAREEPLEEVLPVFTSNVARQIGLKHKGRIEVGLDADVAILSPAGELEELWALGQRMIEA